jgi:hypothetical protein
MRALLILIAVIGVSACASSRGPIIDTKGVDMAKYQEDLADCEQYGREVQPARGVARGAAGGAAVGAAIGAITGSPGRGAGIGAVSGAAQSGVEGDRERSGVVKNCLRGRGYKVLN